MAMKRVDGFCLWNIDVPLPAANPILALLTTCLVMVKVWMDLASHALERFVSWLFKTMNVLSRVAENAAGRREQPRGPRPSTVNRSTTRVFDNDPQPLDDTEAQVIMPESLNDAGKPKSYVLVLDCSSKSLESGKNSIINIAASTHIELFQALRVWQGVRLRSFTGAIRAVFSPWSVRVKLDWIQCDYPGKLSTVKGSFENNLPESRPQWIYSNQRDPILKTELNTFYNFPELCRTGSTQVLRKMPRRSLPLLESELRHELNMGPIPVLILENSYDIIKPLLIYIVVGVPLGLSLFFVGERQLRSWQSWVVFAGLWLNLVILVVFESGFFMTFLISLSQSHHHRLKPGFCRTIFDVCGHRVVTDSPTSWSQQEYICILYAQGILAISKGNDSMEANEIWANDDQANRDILPVSPRPQSSRDEKSEDIALQSKASASSSKPGDGSRASQLSPKNQDRKGKENDTADKFLYMCYPSSHGRGLREVTVGPDDDLPRDGILIKDLKRRYYSQRTSLQRLRTLRDFSTIHLQRFEYYAQGPQAVSWKWPEETDSDWKCTRAPLDSKGAPGFDKFMLHLWVNECDAANKAATTSGDEQEGWHTQLIMKFKDKTYKLQLHMSKLSPHTEWDSRTTFVTLDLEDRLAPEPGRGAEPSSERPKAPDLRSVNLEIDYGADTLTIYHRTPKKLSKLKSDSTGINTPVAWAIWIDEDFSVPWYIVLVLILIIIVTCIFASFYGWPIGSYIIAATGLVMTGWVLRAKDSKHPRLD